jgi:hypothetical protein
MATLLKAFLWSLFLGVISFNSNAQSCDCKKDVDFLVQAYLNDYAGMSDFKVAHRNYQKDLDKIIKKANKTRSIEKCHEIMGSLIAYLNNSHVVYGATQENPLHAQLEKSRSDVSQEPELLFIDSSTVLITIKSADLYYKSHLDSLIESNFTRLQKTNHFIIDVRGNGGGGDAMFDALIPFLYTSPILIHMAQLWTSPNNVKMFEDLLSNPDIPSEGKEMIRQIVEKGKSNINSFIDISDNKVDTIYLDKVAQYPQKVSVIIDKECKSATEQFLLLAKQSAKVRIYGKENSGGALDYSNLNFIVTPSGYWYASVPTTRTNRLPDNPVDPHGITPHIIIPKEVKNEVEFVRLKS